MVDRCAIQRIVLDLLSDQHLRLTPSDLDRAVRREIPLIHRRELRVAIKDLVSNGKIAYTQHNLTTHLEINYQRPIQISNRIILAPPKTEPKVGPGKVVIRLQDGTAFGGGDHPTTRMLLGGLDFITSTEFSDDDIRIAHALDIGAGTGVLSIAAAQLGIAHVEGVDIDPAACHEAETNARLNRLQGHIQFSLKALDQFPKKKFDLIMANLRPPTLKEMMPTMATLSSPNAIWLISGCRVEERDRLKKWLPVAHTKLIWEEDVTGWGAFAVIGADRKNSQN